MKSIFLTGTDTNCGKTHAAAVLMLRYPELVYWKPVQTGYPEDDDTRKVKELTGLSCERFLNPGFTFKEPLSPHRAAELEKRTLELYELLQMYHEYSLKYTLLMEGAGGLMVPLNRTATWLDLLKAINVPIVIAARTELGTINHSLLPTALLRKEKLNVSGFIFCGKENQDNVKTIQDFSGVSSLGSFDMDAEKLTDAAGRIDKGGILELV